jgi:hypothetical protein
MIKIQARNQSTTSRIQNGVEKEPMPQITASFFILERDRLPINPEVIILEIRNLKLNFLA